MNARATFYDFGTNRPRTPAGEEVLRQAAMDSMKEARPKKPKASHHSNARLPNGERSRIAKMKRDTCLRYIGRAPIRFEALVYAQQLSPQTVRDYVNRLHSAGMVKRYRDPSNRSFKIIEITESGKEYLRELLGAENG